MGFTLSYQVLFEVKILHHYYLNKAGALFDDMTPSGKAEVLRGYDVRNFLTIEPTPATAALLGKHHCIYRNTPTGLIAGLQAIKNGADNLPAFAFPDDLHFTFTLQFSDSYFTNYTALPLLEEEGIFYFLQNRTGGSSKRFPYLTQFPAAFAAGTYSAGDILSDNPANPAQLFIANKLTTAAPPGADWINDPLAGGQPLQYLTRKDRLPVYTDLLRYNTGQPDLTLTITLTDRWGNTLEPPFKTTTDAGNTAALVDLHLLPEDLYTIKLEDAGNAYSQELLFYHLQNSTDPSLILDLSVKSEDASYNMTDALGVLRQPIYEIRFSNRATRWRYLGEKFSNKPEVGPHPLTRLGLVGVSVPDADGNLVEDLPNPGVRMIKTEHPVNDNRHYNVISEIYIH